jgi:plastocyanin
MAKKNNKNKAGRKLVFAFVVLLIIAFVAAAMYLSLPSGTVQNPAIITIINNIINNNIPSSTTITGAATTTVTTASAPGQTPTTVNTGTFQPSAVTLEIKSWGFNPNTVTLLKGSTATWTNKDSVTHTVTSAGNFDSGDIAAGASWTYTFNKAGTFEYSCKYHSSMTGKVVITE